MSVTKAGLAGTDRRNRGGRTMGRGLSESRGSSSVREHTRLGGAPTYSAQYVQEFRTLECHVPKGATY